MPEGFWPEFWAAAKAAGLLGTIIMAGLYWLARKDLEKEREKDEARHTATMEVLQSIRTFMEVIKDRIPRQ